MVDVLYILGRGSKHNDDELRYSLRSLDKYGKNIGRVFICGNCPEWVKNVVHIPCEDTYQPAQNHFVKVFKAIEKGISDEFLLMNDDFIIMDEFDASKYPYFHRGELEKAQPTNMYQEVIENTRQFLHDNGRTTFGYNVHCPFRYVGNKFMELLPLSNCVKTSRIGYSARILYGNLNSVRGQEVKDCKCYDDIIVGKNPMNCISLADDCDCILKMLSEVFKEKSRWEK